MFVAFQRVMSGESNAVTAAFTDLTLLEKSVLIPIVLMILCIGMFPNFILEISEPAVNQLIQSINQALIP
jgi:NADH-quinone oxidoreductase subunit M